MKIIYSARFTIELLIVFLFVSSFASAEVIFWNKLESQTGILQSEVGPGIQQTSYIYSDWQEALIAPAKFGNGLYVNHDIREGWLGDGANFFATDTRSST